MQFVIYRNSGRSILYPLLINVTSDIIGTLNTRLVIPLLPVGRYPNLEVRPARLNPVLELIDGNQYVMMTHELASIPLKALGAEFCDGSIYRQTVKDALDFILDGI
ncbi:plasmid maintenance protein CcdB [Klebsiella sp. RIT-PI-d]|uniref:CcdB family protein n=1 Tax=Klebsiella sp. RIT-PI-d TaxID=1681196 RepID=UPI0006761016|nr:CcdB family protein [Klebsiella sp. RIT-PI-d]KNC06060.1 plasmid maintenance protein CcdB [Klebsiella sp. RIT-PI-d]